MGLEEPLPGTARVSDSLVGGLGNVARLRHSNTNHACASHLASNETNSRSQYWTEREVFRGAMQMVDMQATLCLDGETNGWSLD